MTPQEFATRAVGLPWQRWQASWDCMDCFGLLVLYHREVMGIDLGGPLQSYISTGHAGADGWQECAAEPGAVCFMMWQNGAPTHCGLLMPGAMVLHSEGMDDRPGSVRITRLAAMQRTYGEIIFYRYTPKC